MGESNTVEYRPITAVWEITMGCNMRCKHCGSACEGPLEGELTTEEALRLCEDIAELGLSWLTLSGGEPTTRKDWDKIAYKLNSCGVIPNMITNGWLLDEDIAKRAKDSGINTLAFSLDGLEKTHDFIRREGSYAKIMRAIDIALKQGVNCSIITTVNNININELDQMHEILSTKGLFGWQLQIGLPMGTMAKHNDIVAQPHHADDIIDFAYRASQKGGIEIQLSDCIGYFNKKEIAVRVRQIGTSDAYEWDGCNAGKYNFGILHNGDILGCTSIRDRQFIEGNIRNTPLKEIWNNPEGFAWNRYISKEKLAGVCKKCGYGGRCKGGCANTRLTMEGSIYGENKYCSYNLAVKKSEEQLKDIDDFAVMLEKSRKFIENSSYQLAEILLSKALKIEPENKEALNLYGLTSFMLENYEDAKAANEILIKKYPDDPYVNKGYGLSIARLGNVDDGIRYLKKAIELSDSSFLDPYHDLAVIYFENGRIKEAIETLEKGRAISEEFAQKSEEFYKTMLEMQE